MHLDDIKIKTVNRNIKTQEISVLGKIGNAIGHHFTYFLSRYNVYQRSYKDDRMFNCKTNAIYQGKSDLDTTGSQDWSFWARTRRWAVAPFSMSTLRLPVWLRNKAVFPALDVIAKTAITWCKKHARRKHGWKFHLSCEISCWMAKDL